MCYGYQPAGTEGWGYSLLQAMTRQNKRKASTAFGPAQRETPVGKTAQLASQSRQKKRKRGNAFLFVVCVWCFSFLVPKIASLCTLAASICPPGYYTRLLRAYAFLFVYPSSLSGTPLARSPTCKPHMGSFENGWDTLQCPENRIEKCTNVLQFPPAIQSLGVSTR